MLRVSNIPAHPQVRVEPLVTQLAQSFDSLTKGKARVAVLFSGGIDCTVITYLAHRYVTLMSGTQLQHPILCRRHIPLGEPIDLLNVAFENPRKIRVQQEGNLGMSRNQHQKAKQNNIQQNDYALYGVPDRVTGLEELEELRRVCQGRSWNFVSYILLLRKIHPEIKTGGNQCFVRGELDLFSLQCLCSICGWLLRNVRLPVQQSSHSWRPHELSWIL